MVSIIVGKKRAQFVRVEFYLPLARYRSGKPILAFSSKPTCFSWAAMCFGVISSVVKCVICTYGETAWGSPGATQWASSEAKGLASEAQRSFAALRMTGWGENSG